MKMNKARNLPLVGVTVLTRWEVTVLHKVGLSVLDGSDGRLSRVETVRLVRALEKMEHALRLSDF